ncbi:Plasma kallikrein, partial [Zancudomyces culisetae]
MKVIAAGFGLTHPSISSSGAKVAKKVDLKISENDVCKKLNNYWDGTNDGETVCNIVENGRDTCTGDSGGPLVYSQGGSHQLVGITSFGILPYELRQNPTCGTNGGAAFYTHV